ncbi:uncharacterized protein AMSG_08987 [Thecamonas trahens ATCC 50062]|uniref:EF-hand domain-containing protein n=1 Tax=Thecamonas trahens ATCC 50062 TaxID=461836 RepID=A0A0L0DKK5_THETB|nr:hypothetical protein AMSG_08987 [Thecamonas trahens ATCC 50062]KNC52842.1 hypothetical protein AMSG_08987 [Thecamonas trahens ATCC 50062]|eukprot:XP_013754946.1 hypothetical protein AMSG_08987 [Thecamonas trahens ATCC 50062]
MVSVSALTAALVLAVVVAQAHGQCPSNTTASNVAGKSVTNLCMQSFTDANIVIDSTLSTTVSGKLVVAATTTLDVRTVLNLDDLEVRGALTVKDGTVSTSDLDLTVGSILTFRVGDSVPAITIRSSGNVTAAGSLVVAIPAAYTFDVGTRVVLFSGFSAFNGQFTTITLQDEAATARDSSSCASFTAADVDGSGAIDEAEFAAWSSSLAARRCMGTASGSATRGTTRRLLGGSARRATLDCTTTAGECAIVGVAAAASGCPACPKCTDNAGLAAGATVGVFIGVVIVVIVALLLLACLKRRRRRRAARLAAEDAAAAVRARQEAEAAAKREAKASKSKTFEQIAHQNVEGVVPGAKAPVLVEDSDKESNSRGSSSDYSYSYSS